jgi:ribosome-associated protein
MGVTEAVLRRALAAKRKKGSKGASDGASSRTGKRRAPSGQGSKRSVAARDRSSLRSASAGSRSASASGGGSARRGSGRVRSLAAAAPATVRTDSRRVREAADAAQVAIDAALDKKALMPVLIDVSAMASYTDFIGIVSGRSDRQVDAIADGITQAMKARGRLPLGQEGTGTGRWTLLDFGDVVIHVFYHPVREFYDLESLWVDAPRVPLKIPPEAMITQPDALYGSL